MIVLSMLCASTTKNYGYVQANDTTFCSKQIVNACSVHRDYFELALNTRDKAHECCDLVILAMCCHPSRLGC